MFCITLCGPRTKKFGDPCFKEQQHISAAEFLWALQAIPTPPSDELYSEPHAVTLELNENVPLSIKQGM